MNKHWSRFRLLVLAALLLAGSACVSQGKNMLAEDNKTPRIKTGFYVDRGSRGSGVLHLARFLAYSPQLDLVLLDGEDLRARFAPVQKILQDGIIKLRQALDQVLPGPPEALAFHRAKTLGSKHRRLAFQQVDDARKSLAVVHRVLHGQRMYPKPLPELAYHFLRPCALAVHLVDECDGR